MSRAPHRTFEGVIEQFRAREAPEQVMCLVDDLPLQKLVAHWEMAPLRPIPGLRPRPTGESEAALWDWLWSHTEVDLRDLADGLGQSLPRLRAQLAVARRNRLIYPDGRIHEHARRFLHARIAQDLGASSTRGRAR